MSFFPFPVVERTSIAPIPDPRPLRAEQVPLTHQQRQQWIATELVMVVPILVAQRQRIDPLRHQRLHRVLDAARVPVVGETGGKLPDQPSPGFHLPQQHRPTIRAQPPPVKARLHLPSTPPWKDVLRPVTLGRHKAASFWVHKYF